MKKIKWKNVVKAIVFIFCTSVILYDAFMLSFGSFITGYLYSWTWTGFITFILFCGTATMLYEDFEEQIKSTPTSRQTFRKGTTRK